MLTKEFKEAALRQSERMTAEDFIRVFEKIGSVRAKGADNLSATIEKTLKRFR